MTHMQIKEIEGLSGMERATIRFYEQEGFIRPKRLDNGYRDYSQEDLQILLRIKLLRSLNISLEEIKEVKDGSQDLADTLSKQISKLDQDIQDVSYAKDVCRALRRDRVSFANLDAQKYLDGIDRTTKETGTTYFSVKENEISQVFNYWRRFLARSFDFFIYNILWSAFIGTAFHITILGRTSLGLVFDAIIVLLLVLFLEPLWLHLFGTTLGKAIFGLRIKNPNGSNLSYGQALDRTFGVIATGMGFNIPIYGLYRLWKSLKISIKNESQPWDYSVSYSIKDTKAYRGPVYMGGIAALVAITLIIGSAQDLPPNRGDLTVSEFVDNHRYYSKHLGINYKDEYLNEQGKWVKNVGGSEAIVRTDNSKPKFKFTIEDGYVTGISYPLKIEDNTFTYHRDNESMKVAALAFGGAQDEIGIFSKKLERIVDQVSIGNDFNFTEAGVTFSYSDSEFSMEK